MSLLVSSLVGPTGTVIGVDRSDASVRLAQERAIHAHLTHVTFRESDLADLTCDGEFDAVVGRFILLYLADPEAVLRRTCTAVRPGGVVVFHEMDMIAARSAPRVPLYECVLDWIRETFRRGGVEVDMGSRLFATFRSAGLPEPEMLLHARIEGRRDSEAYAYITDVLRSLLPMSERLGVVTAAEVQVDTLAERLRDEVVRTKAVLILPSLVGAWTRLPVRP